MVFRPAKHKPVPDYQVFNAIRDAASPAYQARIPAATQASVQATQQALLTNTPSRNEFTGVLMNRIGRVIGRDMSWDNPLGKFKIGMMEDGDTIEEVMVGLIQARAYDVTRDYLEKDLFAQERPNVQASFHKINREDQYKYTVHDTDLRRAFRSSDGFGLTEFVSQVMGAAVKSDAVDEYLLMMGLFRGAYDNGGFFKVNVPDVRNLNSAKEEANALLRAIRTYSNNLKTVSTRYNAAGMPVATTADELELFLPNEVDAALDVETLASVFNLDRADVHTRKNAFPYEDFNIPGLQAVLTTRDFFVVADTHYEVTELPNPAGRYRNFWLQHDQIISMSRFAPTILFTTEPGDPIVISDAPVASISEITVYGENESGELESVTEVQRGSEYVAEAIAETNPEGGNNIAVRYGLIGAESYDTRISKFGGIRIGAQETADEITVTAKAVGNNTVKTQTLKVVKGDRLQLWPNPEVITEKPKAGAGKTTKG